MKLKNTNKNPVGRPRGSSGATIRAVTVITNELAQSLEILRTDYDTSLAHLLAREFTDSPSRVLTAISRYLPKELNLTANGPQNPFIDALKSINDNIIEVSADPIPENTPDTGDGPV